MGYPTCYHHVFVRTIFFVVLSLCLVLCLFPDDGFTTAAPRPAPEGDPKSKPRETTGLSALASPNPFNPVTEISFVVPEGADAGLRTTVEVFDLTGRRVVSLLDEGLDPGPQSVLWRGDDDAGMPVGSGLYFVRIRSGGGESVVKLLLVE